MNRSELVQIAHGLKASRPRQPRKGEVMFEVVQAWRTQWEETVFKLADALHLQDKPRSNFLAACGLLHASEDPTEPVEVQS